MFSCVCANQASKLANVATSNDGALKNKVCGYCLSQGQRVSVAAVRLNIVVLGVIIIIMVVDD
jgi:hypothetical protein